MKIQILSNPENIRTLKENKDKIYLEIIEGNTIEWADVKAKFRKK